MLLLASCGDGTAPAPATLPSADPGLVDAGPCRLRDAPVKTCDLPSEIAGSYGIVQRRNLALPTIKLRSRNAAVGARVVAAELAATSLLPTGERRTVARARHHEAGGPRYPATVEVRHCVPVTIESRVRAMP